MFAEVFRSCNQFLRYVGSAAPFNALRRPAASSEASRGDAQKKIAALETEILMYGIALNGVSQGICFFDKTERLILSNRRYAEMYRISPERLRPGMTLSEVIALREAAGTSAMIAGGNYLAFARSVNAGSGSRTWTAQLQDERTIQICHEPTPDGEWVATHEDITEANALRTIQSERISLQALIDSVPDYLWVKDTNSRFVVVNRALANDSGRSKTSDMIGLSDFDLHDVEQAQDFRDVEQNIIRSTQPITNRQECVVDVSGAKKWLLSTKMPLKNDRNEVYGLVGIARDITERVRAEDELERLQEFLHLVIESVPEAILVRAVRGRRVTLLNRAAEEFFGMRREDLVGKTIDELYAIECAGRVIEEDNQLLTAGEILLEDQRIELRNRGARNVALSRKLLRDKYGAPEYMLTVIQDTTERKRAEERIAHLAHHDPLTDLPNRATFNEHLNRTLSAATESARRFAVLCVDIDRLKEVNDVFGHAAGDQLLREVSRRMLAAAGSAFLARLGGDEFALVAEIAAPASNFTALAGRLLAAAGSEIAIQGARICASISIGVAVFPEDGRDVATLLANADAALYRAKAEGRGITRFFEPGMDKRIRERHALRNDLSFAIARGELAVFYQPQAELTGKIVGFEALLRWRHPLRGMVPPSVFIPLAEESGLIVAIGEWALRQVCIEAASWPERLGVAVNLSPVQFRHSDLPSLVHSILLETGLPASRLELEITEGVLIADSARALSVLRRLKSLGLRIAMDDFGKGYSSLSYLQSFPFDKIKIDRAFVSKALRNPQSAAIVRAILGLARGLDLLVLAEGIETEEELAFFRAEKCDQAQGYLIGRPEPIEAYAEVLGRPVSLRKINRAEVM